MDLFHANSYAFVPLLSSLNQILGSLFSFFSMTSILVVVLFHA
jgi:hypothetical protein